MNLYSMYLVAQIIESALLIIFLLVLIFALFKTLGLVKKTSKNLNNLIESICGKIDLIMSKLSWMNIFRRDGL